MIIQNANLSIQPIQSGVNLSTAVLNMVPGIPAQSPQSPTSQQLRVAVDGINQVMRQSNQSLEFSVDSDTKEPVVKVMDTETGQLIVQIPSKVALAIAQSIDQQQHGLLLSNKA